MEAFKEILRGWTFCCVKLAGLLFNKLRIAALFDLFVVCALVFIAAAAAFAARIFNKVFFNFLILFFYFSNIIYINIVTNLQLAVEIVEQNS